jgi:F-type H+-transporting ATPase subunit delta
MKLSKEGRRTARELFDLTLVNGKIDPTRVRTIADDVAATKPRQYVQLLKEYARLVRLEVGRHHAVVESAAALDADTSASLEREIREQFGADVTIEFRVNPDLIGGLRVKVGSDVWDGSIRSRLQLLKTQL